MRTLQCHKAATPTPAGMEEKQCAHNEREGEGGGGG